MPTPSNNSQIRQYNIRTLLKFMKEKGPISKRDLQKLTGLSWGAVSSITGALYDCGYVMSVGKQVTNIGRKPFELDINTEDFYVVGVDLNLSGLCAVITDMKGRIIREWMRFFVHNDYQCVMDTLFSLVDEILLNEYSHKKILGIGLAVQGLVKMEEGISDYLPNIRDWKDVPLKDMMEQRYGYDTLLVHDPYCLMAAEKAFGVSFLNVASNAILLRIDSGIGMSLMINGQPYFGSSGKAGEFGHIPVNSQGPLCVCGRRGCLEEYVSCNGLVRRFVEQINSGQSTNVNIENISNVNCRMLADAAQCGDALCVNLFKQMGEYLGLSLSMIINVLNPDLVVIYSELAPYRKLFLDAVKEQLDAHIYDGIPAKLVFSELDRNAAAQGAALMVSDKKVDELELPFTAFSDIETEETDA